MKKGLLLLLLVLMTGCGGNSIVVKKFDPAFVLHVPELQKLNNPADIKKYAGYLDKGDTFPLELNFDNDTVGFRQKSIDVEIKQRLYFMMKMPENPTKEELDRLGKLNFEKMSESELMDFFSRYMLYVSKDAEHWAPMYDWPALKQVLGIKRGTFSFGVGMEKDKGVKSVFTVKTEK